MFKGKVAWCLGSESGSKAGSGMQKRLRALSVLLALAGCGGSFDDVPMSSANATPLTEKAFDLHGILRPDKAGRWYIQNTDRHWPLGLTRVQHCPGDSDCTAGDLARGPFLRVMFDRAYTDAGVISVTPDDDFGPRGIEGFSNLGVSSATIKVAVNKHVIDPRAILSHAPAGAGNFWIHVRMVDRY